MHFAQFKQLIVATFTKCFKIKYIYKTSNICTRTRNYSNISFVTYLKKDCYINALKKMHIRWLMQSSNCGIRLEELHVLINLRNRQPFQGFNASSPFGRTSYPVNLADRVQRLFWEPIWDVCRAGRNTTVVRKGKIFESERERENKLEDVLEWVREHLGKASSWMVRSSSIV